MYLAGNKSTEMVGKLKGLKTLQEKYILGCICEVLLYMTLLHMESRLLHTYFNFMRILMVIFHLHLLWVWPFWASILPSSCILLQDSVEGTPCSHVCRTSLYPPGTHFQMIPCTLTDSVPLHQDPLHSVLPNAEVS